MKKLLILLYGIQYKHIRTKILKIVGFLEGHYAVSPTIRVIFKKYHGVEVGMYSSGACFSVSMFRPNTKIGRYCSIAPSARRYNAEHPAEFISTHALFFNSRFGFVEEDKVKRSQIDIGHDVWIGHNAVILASVNKIGNGAIIGAGAIVHQDVPDFAIVLGNPGRVVRYRFERDMIDRINKSSWWDKEPGQIKEVLSLFTVPLDNEIMQKIEAWEGSLNEIGI